MYIIFAAALACLLGRLIWKELGRTALSRPVRAGLTALGVVVSAALVFWGAVYLSIRLFQWNDPITW